MVGADGGKEWNWDWNNPSHPTSNITVIFNYRGGGVILIKTNKSANKENYVFTHYVPKP